MKLRSIKKALIISILLLLVQGATAIPALRRWVTVKQSDGTFLQVSMAGDEWMHYTATRDGIAVVRNSAGTYCYAALRGRDVVSSGIIAHEAGQRSLREAGSMVTARELNNLAMTRRQLLRQAPARPRAERRAPRQRLYSGTHHVPVVLAYFTDKSFSADTAATKAFYESMLNEHGFSRFGANGSVNDYFKDMSRGRFNLVFDVIGPVRVSHQSTYYGGPSVYFGGTDHVGEFIAEAVTKADSIYQPDWNSYDWDGDGEIEQVFVLYAGYGQATGGGTGLIWPCKWTLDEAKEGGDGPGSLNLRGTMVNTFACGNELFGSTGSTYMGLGVFCHEFSHCMGLPDLYDTAYGSSPAMGDWDLMAHGSYNGPKGIGWCPAGWTSYERAEAGWLDLTELQPGDTVRGMKSMDEGGEAYAIYNDANRNEYYLLENHKHVGWDAYTPEEGLLAIHVDYDSTLFANNIVNTTGTFTPAEGYDGTFYNDHARMVPFSRLRSLDDETYYYTYPMVGKRFVVDSLTDLSKPAAMVYNAQADGSLFMHKPVRDIAKDAEGNISFNYMTTPTVPTAILSAEQAQTNDPMRIYGMGGEQLGTARRGYGSHATPTIVVTKQGDKVVKRLAR